MFAVAIIQLGELTFPLETSAQETGIKASVIFGELRIGGGNSVLAVTPVGTTERKVRQYFADIPILVDVAKCESRFRQYNSYGDVLRGRQNAQDVGVLQINERYHGAKAKQLGINIYSLEGNLEYGRYLYETSGTAPWVHSSKCWGTTREVALAK